MLRLTGLSLAAALMATSAHATIIIADGQIGGPLDNVLFNNNPPDGTAVQGVLNGTLFPVFFIGNGTEILHGNGGQARLEAVDGGLNYVDFGIGPGAGFETAEFNFNTTRTAPGTSVTITAWDQFGASFAGNFALTPNGQNFFNLTTANNELITRITLATANDYIDLRRIRIGGAQTISSGVPEPSTWAMMLIGFAGLGFCYRARARQLAAQA
ncbi:MAG: PEPxxWA-CTERM sorting domain-containing protein [Methylobacteriaceae bacterium]|nr:PEPxxWA-CTERM sorting domain-containing protein [Methylobacteriaceae bacterium]